MPEVAAKLHDLLFDRKKPDRWGVAIVKPALLILAADAILL